jgi:hypothetical protein
MITHPAMRSAPRRRHGQDGTRVNRLALAPMHFSEPGPFPLSSSTEEEPWIAERGVLVGVRDTGRLHDRATQYSTGRMTWG